MSVLRHITLHHRSVAHFPAAQRHERWLSTHSPDFLPLFRTTPLVAFNAESDVAALGGLTIAFAEVTGQRWERSANHARTHFNDSLSVNISLDIQAQGLAGERGFTQAPGAALLTDLAQPSTHESSSGHSAQIIVNRSMAMAAGIDVAGLHGIVLSPAAGAMLRSHVLQLRHGMPQMLEAEAPRIARTMIDILVLSINATGQPIADLAPSLRDTLASRVRGEISANLGSSMLTISNLCRRLNVSRSTLHRLFDQGGGVQAYIRQARLAAARQALDDPANTERISAIAERLGFADPAHFSRSFRERYGDSPSDYRARAQSR